MSRELQKMVVVITGASAGIGRALAEALAARGARLVLAARRMDRLDALNRTLGGQHLCVQADVSNRSECEALIERAISHFGRIDTLVCNAGHGLLRPVAGTTADEMEHLFRTNVFGTADCIHAATPHLLRQTERNGWRGQIVIVSSAVARRAIPYFGAYSATKAAQLSLAEAMRVELQPDRIAVTSIHPIGTDTEFGDVSASLSAGTRPHRMRAEKRQSPEEVARHIVRAIVRPRPEVWPYPPSRWILGLATLLPRLVDRVLSSRRAEISGNNND